MARPRAGRSVPVCRAELDALQEQIATERNAAFLGQTVEALVEGEHKAVARAHARNKLVFFADAQIDRLAGASA